MRILAISDLHGDSDLSAAAARVAAEQDADVVMLAGDLSSFGREFEGIVAPFAALGKPVLLVGGNHDDPDRIEDLAAEYGAIHLEGYGAIVDGVGFIGSRGFRFGRFRHDTASVEASMRRAARYARAERLVSMTHVHPSGTEMSGLSVYVQGSETIERLIRELKPSVHVCGHVHEGAGLVEELGETKVVNVSGTPTIIDI